MFNFIKNFFKDNSEEVKKAGKGLHPSPRDDRDLALSSNIPDIKRYPKEKPCPFDLRIHNQGVNPSCVGHASSAVKEGMETILKYADSFD